MSTSKAFPARAEPGPELASQVRSWRPRSRTCAAGSLTRPGSRAASSCASPTPSGRWPAVTSQNERLAQTLREARDQIMKLKEEVDRLAQPPAGFGTFLEPQRGRLDRRLHRRPQAPRQRQPVGRPRRPDRGQEVMLNEALNVVAALEFEEVGEVVMFKELLADGDRVLVIANADEERVVRLAEPLRDADASAPATRCCSTPAPATSTRRCPKSEVEELVLEEVPDIDYRDIGGLVRPDRADPRRGRAALPAPRAVQGAPAQAAEGRAALRPARLRQDADRQGGRQLAGQEGRREDRPGGHARTSSTSRAPSCSTSTSARPSGTSGWSSSAPVRRPARARRSSCSSTRWTRCSAPAAPASPPTSRTRSSRSCSARSTASSCSRTSSSSAPPTART